MVDEYREVNFKKYCGSCKNSDSLEIDDPCFECLDHPTNLYSEKPVNWKEKEK